MSNKQRLFRQPPDHIGVMLDQLRDAHTAQRRIGIGVDRGDVTVQIRPGRRLNGVSGPLERRLPTVPTMRSQPRAVNQNGMLCVHVSPL